MRKLLILFLTVLSCFSGFAQSETSDMITYDTVLGTIQTNTWMVARITRPRNYFTAGHPDTASRRIFVFMPGQGEMNANQDTNSLKTKTVIYGPHYWLGRDGWDGGVETGSGRHYPIFITLIQNVENPRPWVILPKLQDLMTKFHPRGGKFDLGGLSMGGFTWGRFITYAAYEGDETAMSMIGSYTCLQGLSSQSFNAYSYGNAGFGIWAEKYGGKFFGLEGTQDSRNVWICSEYMNSVVPGSAYFSYETYGGGTHCCWNSMINPFETDWNCITKTNTNLYSKAAHPNTLGTYTYGSILQWVLQQGDTTLAGSGVATLAAHAGVDQNVILPTSSTTLFGSAVGDVASVLWTKESGPSGGTIADPDELTTDISDLQEGTYVFRLTVTDGEGTTAYDEINLFVLPAPNTPPTAQAGPDRTIYYPQDTVQLHGSGIDTDGTVTGFKWTKQSGGSLNFANENASETYASDLAPGIYTLRLTATDNVGGTGYDEMTVTVLDTTTTSEGTLKRLNVNIYNNPTSGRYDNSEWNNWKATTDVSMSNLLYEDGTSSGITVSMTALGDKVSTNAAGYGPGVMCPTTVLREALYWSGEKTITLSGLVPGRAYNISLYASRSNSGQSTIFTIGQTSTEISTYNNYSNVAVFAGVVPSGSSIVITARGVGQYGYLNGFTLETGGAAAPNTPPIVSAGSDQTITLPNSTVTLTGTVTDEGGDLIYAWTKVSGPLGGTINSPDSLSTTVTELPQGVHEYLLTVTDTGGLSSSASVKVTVNAAGNQAPTVSAGSDITITLPINSVQLTATASDPDGTISAYSWTKVSDEAGGTITAPNAATTMVTGLAAGISTFRVTVTDNQGATAYDDVKVTINPAPPVPGTRKPIAGLGEYQIGFLDNNGYLYGIGSKKNLGLNPSSDPAIPERLNVPSDLSFKAVEGALHGLGAIDDAGNVWMAGENLQAQHGMGDQDDVQGPRKILVDSAGDPFTNIKSITAYFSVSKNAGGWFAIKEDGTLWTWGNTGWGFRGNGTSLDADQYTSRPVQVAIPGDRQVKQIVAGQFVILLCTDGTVWTWGPASANSLGRSIPDGGGTITQLTSLSNITQVAGAGQSFSYALGADGRLFGWGAWGNFLGDLVNPTGTGKAYPTPTLLTNITNYLPATIKKIVTNYTATHVVLEDGRLFGWGDGSQGGIGNGTSLDFTITPTPYQFNGVAGQVMVKVPQEIAPGIQFDEVWGGGCYLYATYARDIDGKLYCWGRGKGSVLANAIKAPNSTLTAERNNALTLPWITQVDPFSITTSYISTSPDCVDGTSTGSPCSTYTIPSNTAPTADAGPDQQVLIGSSTRLQGSATDNVFVARYLWKQLSGPSQAVLDLVTSPTPRISNLIKGVYTFQLTATDNGWLSDTDTVTITVGEPPARTQKRPKGIIIKTN